MLIPIINSDKPTYKHPIIVIHYKLFKSLPTTAFTLTEGLQVICVVVCVKLVACYYEYMFITFVWYSLLCVKWLLYMLWQFHLLSPPYCYNTEFRVGLLSSVVTYCVILVTFGVLSAVLDYPFSSTIAILIFIACSQLNLEASAWN